MASEGSLLLQAVTRPVSTAPPTSFVVAVSGTVCPATMVAVAGATVTDATGGTVTLIAAVPDWPSLWR